MAEGTNLGTLWFDVDLKTDKLTQGNEKIQQILKTLKVDVDDTSVEALRKKIETILGKEAFKINIDAGNVDLKAVTESIKANAEAHQKSAQSATQDADAKKAAARATDDEAEATKKANVEKERQAKLMLQVVSLQKDFEKLLNLSPARTGLDAESERIKTLSASINGLAEDVKKIPPTKSLQELSAKFANLRTTVNGLWKESGQEIGQRILLNNFQQLKEKADSFQKTIENIRAKSSDLGIDPTKINLASQAITGLIAQYEKFDTTKLSGGDLSEFRSQLALVKAQFRDLVSEYNQYNKAQERAEREITKAIEKQLKEREALTEKSVKKLKDLEASITRGDSAGRDMSTLKNAYSQLNGLSKLLEKTTPNDTAFAKRMQDVKTLIDDVERLRKAEEKLNAAREQANKRNDNAALKALKDEENSVLAAWKKYDELGAKIRELEALRSRGEKANIDLTQIDAAIQKYEQLRQIMMQIVSNGGKTNYGNLTKDFLAGRGAQNTFREAKGYVDDYKKSLDEAEGRMKKAATTANSLSNKIDELEAKKVDFKNLDTSRFDAAIQKIKSIRDELERFANTGKSNYGNTADEIKRAMGYAAAIKEAHLAIEVLDKAAKKAATSVTTLTDAEQKLAASIKSSTDSMRGQSQVLSDLKSMATQYLSIWGAQSFIHSIIQTGGLLEQQRMSIGAILGDLSQANHLFGQITQLALKSPFGVVQLDTMSKQLTAYNFKYSELYDWTKRLADISAATGTEVSRLALALGHVRSEGALSGYTLRQFAMGNVPLLQTLAQQLGKTTAEIRKMTREKAITYEDVEQALRTLTEEGGIFFNAQEVMSNALNAKFKNMHDAFDIMFGKMAESGVGDVLKKIAETLTVLAKHWQEVGAVMFSVAGTMGVYKLATVGINQAMLQSNVMSGQMSAKQLELMASTGKLSQKLLLQAVAAGKVTVADAEAAAATFNLTKAQLEAVRTTGRASAAFEMGAIAGGKYALKTQLLATQFKSLSFFSIAKWATGAKLAFNGLAAGISTAATAVKGFFLAAWPLLAISAITEVWTHFSQKADDAKDRVKDLLQTANEGFKSLEKSAEQYQVGASVKMDDKMLKESINEMDEVLKSYLPQNAHETLNEAFRIDPDTGKSVHSLKEQYEMLAEELRDAKDAYKEMEKIGNTLEQANDETDGLFDRSFRENTENYIEALKARGNAENDFVGKHLLEIKRLIESNDDLREFAELNDAIFTMSKGESGAKMDDVKGQLDLMRENYEVYQKFQTLVTQTGGELYESWGKYNEEIWKTKDAYGEVDKDLTVFTTSMKEKLVGAFGKPVEEWTKSQKLAVQKATEIFMTGIAGYSDMAEAQRIELEEKILKDFDIKINVDAREANKALTEIQAYLNNLVGEDWVVKLKLQTVGSFEELYDQLDKTVKKSGETIKKLGDGIKKERRKQIDALADSDTFYNTLINDEKEYADAVRNRQKAIETANTKGWKLSSLEKENKKNQSAAHKAESEAEKAAKAKTKQEEARLKIEEELAKQRLELQDAIADAEVAAIENNAERERRQREVEFEKQKRQLDKQVEEWKKKSFELAKKEHEANPKNKTISFYDTPVGKARWQGQKLTPEQEGIYAAQEEARLANMKRYIKEESDARIQALRDYIKEYGDMDQKRAAIEEDYKKRIKEAGTIGEKLTLQAKMEVDLSALDSKKIADTLNLEDIFNDLGVQSIEKMKSMRDALREQLSDNNLGFEEYKVIAEQIDKITGAILDKEQRENEVLGIRIPGETTVKRLKEEQEEAMRKALIAAEALAKATLEVEKNKDNVNNLLSQYGKSYKGEITFANSESILKMFEKGSPEYNKVYEGLVELGKAEKNATNATKKKEKADGTATSVSEKLKEALGNARQRVGEFAESLEQINANIQSLPGLMESLGLGDTAAGEMIGGIANAANGAMGAMADFASGNYVGAAMKAVDTIKGLGETFGAWSNSNRAEVEAANKRLENAMNVNTEAVNRLTDQMEKATPSKALDYYQQMLGVMQANEQAARQIMENNAYMYDGGHSLNYDLGGGKTVTFNGKQMSVVEAIFRKLGIDPSHGVYDIGGLIRDLSAADWNKLFQDSIGRELMTALGQSIAGAEDDGNYSGLFKDILEFANSYSEDAYKQMRDKLNEAITGVSFDSMYDNFVSSLKDMDSSAQDWSRNFEEYLRNAVINALAADMIKPLLEEWYGAFAHFMEDDILDELEIEALRNGSGTYSDKNGEEHTWEGINSIIEKGKELQNIVDSMGFKTSSDAVVNSIEAIGDAFKNLISETEPDMDEWGKNIKNSIIENLIEAMVFGEEFKAWMKQLTEDFNKIWEEYEENKDEDKLAAALANLEGQINTKGGEIADIIKKLKETLGYSLSGEDNPFSGLRDSFLDTLTNMEDDAEAFRKRMEQIMVSDMIDKQVFTKAFTIGDDAYDSLDDYITKWNERYAEAVKNNDTTLIDQLLDELVQVREMTIKEAEELRERLKKIADDETFKNLSDSWVSTLMDMSKTAEDWAENIGKIMAEQIIKQMIVPTYIQPLLDELQKVFNDVMDKATTTDAKGNKSYDWKSVVGSDELQAQLDILKKQYPEIQAIVKQIMEAFNLDTSNYKYSGFSNLGDSILESLKSSEGGLEDWAKSMGQQMAEDMAKAYIDSHYSEQIEALNEQWQKALQEGKTAAMKDIEDQLSALYGKMADDPELQRLIDKFRELADNPFKDMASDFASALMDMEQSAEDFANNIAKNLTQEMITKVIKDQYQGEIDALGEQWKQALEQGDSAAIERIRQQLEVLYGQMGDAVKPLLDAISDIGKETDKTFSSMTDSWVSALMDMEGTAEDFAQTVGKTMAQKIITEMIAPVYIQPLLDAMQKRFNQLMAIPGITIAQVLSEMTPFIGQIEDVYRQIQPMIEEIFGTIGIVADSVEEAAEEVEYALDDMKSNFVSALMDMTNSAEDFSKDISKIMAQTFIEKFVLGEQFDRQMEYWQQQYESIIGSGMSEDERKRQLKALRDDIVAYEEAQKKSAAAVMELFGLTTEDNQTATMNMAEKITYDQADQLVGINLAQELTLEQILDELQGKDVLRVGGSGMTWQSASSAQNDEQGKLINATLTNFAQMTAQNHDNIMTQVAMANSHLQMIRDYSKKISDEVVLHLGQIDSNTRHLKNL